MKKTVFVLLFGILLSSCGDYLSIKPDKTRVIPSTLMDLNALLENNLVMNQRFPTINILASDDILILENDWNILTQITPRNAYIWGDDMLNDNDDNEWGAQYRKIFYANIVVEEILKIVPEIREQSEWNRLKGMAHFFRAYAYFELSQLFCRPYNDVSLDSPGLPLRLDPDLNIKVTRSTLRETYGQILDDAITSVSLLPDLPRYKTQPSRMAAYALLSRIYLAMQDYDLALENARNCLSISANLIDFNNVNLMLSNPFTRFNEEVIFHATAIGYSGTFPPQAKVTPLLYLEYSDLDLRKQAFFLTNNDGSHSFRGSYDGTTSIFTGLAVDEVVLVEAECLARLGRIDEANGRMEHLLQKRMKSDYVYSGIRGQQNLLTFILTERRKELLFRGLRWSDLRRLNMDPEREVTIGRDFDTAHVLLPNDSRYTFLIPEKAVVMGGLEQNRR